MQSKRIIDNDHKEILTDKKKEERKFGGLKGKNSKGGAMTAVSKKNKWLKESEQFRNAMRAARGAKPLQGSGPVLGADAYEQDDGLVPCAH